MSLIGIVGVNGYGVFTDINKLNKNKEFLYDVELVTFNNDENAFEEVRDLYNSKQFKGDDMVSPHMFKENYNWITSSCSMIPQSNAFRM